jgi:hypothetical protein
MNAIQLCFLLIKQHLFSLTQRRLNEIQFSYVYATCFDLQLGLPVACQHKNHTNEDITECKWPLFYMHGFCSLEHKICNLKVSYLHR